MAEIFDFQDDIREQIVSALQLSLTPTERALVKRKSTNSVEAYDLYLKGRANFYRFTPTHLPEAVMCFENAIEIDPDFADAYGYLSYCHFSGWVQMYAGFEDSLERANELAERGVSLDGTSAIALTRLGWVQAYVRQYDEGVANLEKAIALAPNDAEIYAAFGQVLNFLGNPDKGLESVEKALSLDTLAPPLWEFYAGISHFHLQQYGPALDRFESVIEQTPKFVPGYAYLAATYVELDRLEEAQATIKTLLGIAPQYTVEKSKNRNPYRIEKLSNRYFDNLRRAGLPEG
jgi:tetratricopeptide (TPR) repeat protein